MKKLILPVLMVLLIALSATAQTDFFALIVNHQIAKGMMAVDVVSAWGMPWRIENSVSNDKVYEIWRYRDYTVIFNDGRVIDFYELRQPAE